MDAGEEYLSDDEERVAYMTSDGGVDEETDSEATRTVTPPPNKEPTSAKDKLRKAFRNIVLQQRFLKAARTHHEEDEHPATDSSDDDEEALSPRVSAAGYYAQTEICSDSDTEQVRKRARKKLKDTFRKLLLQQRFVKAATPQRRSIAFDAQEGMPTSPTTTPPDDPPEIPQTDVRRLSPEEPERERNERPEEGEANVADVLGGLLSTMSSTVKTEIARSLLATFDAETQGDIVRSAGL